MEQEHLWWQRGVIYQIYPRSFQDSDGDGVGDLRGIVSRLDYLTDLGIDAIWLSPIFPSPMADFGYDVANYTDIDPLFGNLADFEALVHEAHTRQLKVLLDLVPNHTSDEHPWFVESRSSRDNPKRDWYIWRDPAPDGSPPNNWVSLFGGPAWTFDEHTGQYYLHLFHTKQPDLNWRNADVRQAMDNVLRFWLDRGIDGFRVDVIWLMIKDAEFRDNPPNPTWREGDPPFGRQLYTYNADQPEVHEVIREMRAVLDAYDERVMIGEIYLPIDRLVTYYGAAHDEVHLPFNFQLVTLPWDARTIADTINTYEEALPDNGWPNWVLGNHDQSRIATRVGPLQARVAAMLLLTLRGTPTIYYGDELGMRDVPISHEQVQDPQGITSPGYSRDPERTPMQWDATEGAGFTAGTPWLPLADDAHVVNVAQERDDPQSMLTFYRALLQLRRTTPALAVGNYTGHPCEGDLVAYIREEQGQRVFVALNFSSEAQTIRDAPEGEVLLSTYPDRVGDQVGEHIRLREHEGLIIAVQTGTE